MKLEEKLWRGTMRQFFIIFTRWGLLEHQNTILMENPYTVQIRYSHGFPILKKSDVMLFISDHCLNLWDMAITTDYKKVDSRLGTKI